MTGHPSRFLCRRLYVRATHAMTSRAIQIKCPAHVIKEVHGESPQKEGPTMSSPPGGSHTKGGAPDPPRQSVDKTGLSYKDFFT